MSKIMLASADLYLKKRVTEILRQLNLELNYHTNDCNSTLVEVKKQTPDLLILDILLPGTMGLEILKKIKGPKDDTIVIIISSLRHPSIIEKLFRLGAKDILVPPFQDATLAASILHYAERM